MAHEFELRVYYEDTDLAGIVYYANYLKFMERARSEAVRAVGIDQLALRKAGLVFAVRSVAIDYIAPATLEDLLVVRSHITRLQGASLSMAQEVWRGDTALTKADVRLACVSPDGGPRRFPADIRGKLATLPNSP